MMITINHDRYEEDDDDEDDDEYDTTWPDQDQQLERLLSRLPPPVCRFPASTFSYSVLKYFKMVTRHETSKA